MIHHYPLQWPIGWPRNDRAAASQFKVGYEQSEYELENELVALGAESAYIATDQEVRVNGRPRRDKQPASPAVAVYFVRNGKQLCIPCDKFTTAGDNLRAVGLTLEAIRRMERYGTSQMVEATLSGFAALPANAQEHTGPRAWHDVLQVTPDADDDIVKAAYRKLAAKYHPDNQQTGDQAKFLEVQAAFTEATS